MTMNTTMNTAKDAAADMGITMNVIMTASIAMKTDSRALDFKAFASTENAIFSLYVRNDVGAHSRY